MLQGIAHHSDSGIMKKHWTNREISDMAVRPLTFTEYDAMLIKESLVVNPWLPPCGQDRATGLMPPVSLRPSSNSYYPQ